MGSARSPSLSQRAMSTGLDLVSLVPLKEFVRKLGRAHPLRILIEAEPDSLPRSEYASKLIGWFQLLRADRDR